MKSMGNSSQREKRLAGQVSLALAAGMFSVVPVAHGMPTPDTVANAKQNSGFAGVTIGDKYTDGAYQRIDIESTPASGYNHTIRWKDFSVAETEHVHFDGKNYMNIVTGTATSAIDGKLTNQGGDLYIINPNGVIFGSTAQVNVGNLYVSTRKETELGSALLTGEVGHSSVSSVLNSGVKGHADIVNLIDQAGYVKANSVIMEGSNIRFLNSSSVATTTATITPQVDGDSNPVLDVEGHQKVTISNHPTAAYLNLRAASGGYIHVGDAEGTYTYSTQGATGVNYALVRDVADLNKINSHTFHNPTDTASNDDLSGNYMLANNIDAMGMTAPIGTANSSGSGAAFTGKFDGMFKTVSNVGKGFTDTDNYLGLFGHTAANAQGENARIENVGVNDVYLNGNYAGGIVGYADHTTLLNVWNAGGTVGRSTRREGDGADYRGGIIGYANQSTLTSSYNAAKSIAGLVDTLVGGSIKDSYNIGNVYVDGTTIYGICFSNEGTIENVYTAAKYTYPSDSKYNGKSEVISSGDTGGGAAEKRYVISDVSSPNSLSSYAFTDTSGKSSISAEGGTNTTWRIYEGASLPYLTSFMKAKGTVSVDYTYDGELTQGTTTTGINNLTGGGAYTGYDTTTNPVKNPYKVYDATSVLATTATAADATYYGANATSSGVTLNNRSGVYIVSDKAASFALFSGGQQGYDLYGNNFRIDKRDLSIKVTPNSDAVNKVYDRTNTKTVYLSTAAALDVVDGLIDSDRTNLGLSGTLTYTYYENQTGDAQNANHGTRWVAISGSNIDTTGSAKDNYNPTLSDPTSRIQAQITPRKVAVSLLTASGIDKTYDGLNTVRNEDEGAALLFSENVNYAAASDQTDKDTTALKSLLQLDNVTLNTNGTATYASSGVSDPDGKYVAFNSSGAVTTKTVNYAGVGLTGNTQGNYILVNAANPSTTLAEGDATTTLTGEGTIKQREINDFVYSGSSTEPFKPYDGLNYLSGGSAHEVVVLETVADGTGSKTGLLTADAGKVFFQTTGTVKFYDGSNQPTADATNSGLTTAAVKATFDVGLNESKEGYVEAIAKSYKPAGSVSRTTTDLVNDLLITKRNITVALETDEGINKTYNGTAKVDGEAAGYATGTINFTSATGNLAYATGSSHLVDDSTSISIVSDASAYLGTHGEAAKDVAFDGSNVASKNIEFSIKMDGAKAANYIVNGEAATNGGTLATKLNGTGTIGQKELRLTFGSATKTYTGTSAVSSIPDVSSDDLVAGEAIGDVIDKAKIAGRYGSDATGTFVEGANAGSYETEAAVAGAKVLYTGLKDGETYKNINTALKSKNYTISNTVYGKGIISKGSIKKAYLEDATNINNNTLASKVYDGTTAYDDSGIIGSKETAKQYLTVDFGTLENDYQIYLTDAEKETLVYTILDAVYNNGQTPDVGTKDMTLTFKFVKEGLANYILADDSDNDVSSTGITIDVSSRGTGSNAKKYQSEITKAPVTVKLTSEPELSKIYDGTTDVKDDGTVVNAADIKGWFTISGTKNGETLALKDGENGIKAAYEDPNAAVDANGNLIDKNIYYTGIVLANGTGKATNYEITKLENADGTDVTSLNKITGVGTINKRTVTVTGYGYAQKEYTGTAGVESYALLMDNVMQEGKADWSVLHEDGITATVAGSEAITSGLTATYIKTGDEASAADVRRDSNRNVLDKNVKYTGLATRFGDNYTVIYNTGGADGKTSSFGSYSTDNNGTLTVTNGGKITAAPVNLDLIQSTDFEQQYNGTVVVENPASHLDMSALPTIAQTILSVTGGTFVGGKDVGDKTVHYTVVINPAAASSDNFDISGEVGDGTGKVIPRVITPTVKSSAAPTKVYDRTNTLKDGDETIPLATIKNWIDLDNLVEGEDLAITAVSGAYDGTDVTATTVNYTGITLGDGTNGSASNYTLSSTSATGSGTITPRTITLTAGAVSKGYDGDTTVTDNIVLTAGDADKAMLAQDGLADDAGVLSNVTSVVGTYDDANVRRNTDRSYTNGAKTVTYTNIASALTEAGKTSANYQVADTADNGTLTGTGTITPVILGVTTNAATKIYDGDNKLLQNADTYFTDNDNMITRLASDGVLTAEGHYYSKNVLDAGQMAMYTLVLKTGTAAQGSNYNADNYNFYGNGNNATLNMMGAGTISQRTIVPVMDEARKVYNGNAAVQTVSGHLVMSGDKSQTGTNVITGDDVTLDVSGASGTYNSKNASTASTNPATTATYTGLGLAGAQNGNYKLTGAITGDGVITAKEISLVLSPTMAKNYDKDANLTDANKAAMNTAVTNWKTVNLTDDMAGDDIRFSGLKGRYGTWTPNGTTGTFTEYSHVIRENGVAQENKHDMLYTFTGLEGNDAENYKLTNGTISAENSGLASTQYFAAAAQTGTIRPVALIMDNLTENWRSATKVYDGKSSVDVYDAEGNLTESRVGNYLTINYTSALGDTGTLDYDTARTTATYVNTTTGLADASAGDKNVAYNVKFSDLTLNDYDLGPDVIAHYNAPVVSEAADNNIARRLLTVSAAGTGNDNIMTYKGQGDAGKVYKTNETYTALRDAGLVVGDTVSVTYDANFDNPNASVDPDAAANDPGWTARHVTYTFKMADGGDSANYTLVENPADAAAARTATDDTARGGIKRREVYVEFKDNNGTGLDKVYDGDSSLFAGENNETSLLASGKSVNDILALVADGNDTGIVEGEDLRLDMAKVKANYVASGDESVDGNEAKNVAVRNGAVTTKDVYFQNLRLAGTGIAGNYVVKAVKKEGDTQDADTLEGSGTIQQRKVDVALKDSTVTKVYDGTSAVVDYTDDHGAIHKYKSDNVTIIPGTANDGLVGTDKLGLEVESAIYYDKSGNETTDAGTGLGVTYRLKWNNTNYSLVRTALTSNQAKIQPRTLQYKDMSGIVATKTYDGNDKVTDFSRLNEAEMFSNVLAGDDLKLDGLANARYASADTWAAADAVAGAEQTVTVNFTVGNSNYRLGASSENFTTQNASSGTFSGWGRIDRAKVTLIPNPVTQKQGSTPTGGYQGTYTGFVGSDDFAKGALTFGRDKDDHSTVVGQKYTLLGFVNGQATSTNENNPTFDSGYRNYYFVTEPNEALLIEMQPSSQDPVIADKQFTPDDYAYNRISKDQDVSHVKRRSTASLQYAENGVNMDDDTRSGLASSMDIEGSGSVVNLAGARMWFLDKGETPEQVAEEAALPMTEEASSEDVSSIDLEREGGETRRSPSLLEILTKASENGEDKKPSIVVNTMDEEDEDEEKESRGVVVVDRTNIAIETQGNTVNLDQMIG